MSQKYPEVQGGGSLIVAWQVRDKNVLLVGGGEVRTGALKEALISAQIYIHGCRLTKQRWQQDASSTPSTLMPKSP